MKATAHTPEVKSILEFLRSIGISVVEKKLGTANFLPGLALGPDCLYVDFVQLKYPGDLLHEAGHLAVTDGESRRHLCPEGTSAEWPTQGEEIAAILWSYAALVHLNLSPSFVFHKDGYKGSSEWLIESFTSGNYIGLPFLEWAGMALSGSNAMLQGKKAFPSMQKWIRD